MAPTQDGSGYGIFGAPRRAGPTLASKRGAAAIVMTRADRARHGPRPPVPVLGAAAATWWNAISQADVVTTTAAA